MEREELKKPPSGLFVGLNSKKSVPGIKSVPPRPVPLSSVPTDPFLIPVIKVIGVFSLVPL